MSSLIKKQRATDHAPWKLLRIPEEETAKTVRLPVGPLLVPVSVWRARHMELIAREYEHGWPLGVWLAADEGPEAIAADLDDFSVIAVELMKLGDRCGYSIARRLREQYGYEGELRAIGDVERDQLPFLAQAGFDAFALKSGEDLHTGRCWREGAEHEEYGLHLQREEL